MYGLILALAIAAQATVMPEPTPEPAHLPVVVQRRVPWGEQPTAIYLPAMLASRDGRWPR